MDVFTGVKVFSATRAKDREELGEVITRWLRTNSAFEIVDRVVTQSSDREFHCLTITLFYNLMKEVQPKTAIKNVIVSNIKEALPGLEAEFAEEKMKKR